MCDCTSRMNEKLAEHNARIAVAIQLTDRIGLRSRLLVQTEKLDKAKRKPVPGVMASFCPFCGEKAETGGIAP